MAAWIWYGPGAPRASASSSARVPSSIAARVRDGKRLLTDGPFAETAEQIAGVGIIEVKDLDEAIEWAANHPDAEWGSVEIRPIVEWKM